MPSSTARAAVSLSDRIHASIHGMRFSGTACAVHNLPSTVTILRVIHLFVISLQVVYIYLKNGSQSFKECVFPALSMQLSIRFTIIQGMRFSTLGMHRCQFPGRWPIERFTIIQGMRFFCTEYAVVTGSVIGLLDGLQSSKGWFFLHRICNCRYGSQSSKGCVPSALSVQLLVSQLLAYRTVYNHPRDAFLLHWICICRYQSTGYWPIGRLTIIQGIQSSKRYVSPTLSMQLLVSGSSVSRSLAYQTVYNRPWDTFLLHYTGYAVVSHPVISLLDALQSSKRCVSPALSMQLSFSVYGLSAYRAVYSHPRQLFLQR